MLRTWTLIIALVLTAALGTSPARAGTPASQAAASADDLFGGYGWQVLLSDAAGLGLALIAWNADDESTAEPLWLASLGIWGVGGSTIHLLHGRRDRALYSLALRVTLPMVGAAIGMASDEGYSDEHLAIGFLVGGFVAQATDWLYLGRLPPEERAASPGGLVIAPAVGATNGGLALGLGGTF